LPLINAETLNATEPKKTGCFWSGAAREALGLWYTWYDYAPSEQWELAEIKICASQFTDKQGVLQRRRSRFLLTCRHKASGKEVFIRWGQYNAGDIQGELSSAEKMACIVKLIAERPADSDWIIDVRTRLAGYESEQVMESVKDQKKKEKEENKNHRR
jgi:hypothetical protein